MYNSGITTLNLAISGKPDKFAKGGCTVSYVGESDSGKTVLALTSMAASFYDLECAVKPVFYAFEPNLLIDIERMYGKKFAKALEIVKGQRVPLEDWQKDVREKFGKSKKPMIAALDSTDALKCTADIAAGQAVKEGSTKAGMGAETAAAWSRSLPEICKAVTINNGLLILLSQVREKPGVVFGSPLYRSGGKALDYYSEIRVWLVNSTKETIDKVKVGGWTRIEVRRNKVTGDARTIYAPIYPSYGVDDTRAMLHFLADTESGAEWVGRDMSTIKVGDQEMSLAEMAAFYEGEGTREILQQKVVEAWQAREAALSRKVLAGRKPRFA